MASIQILFLLLLLVTRISSEAAISFERDPPVWSQLSAVYPDLKNTSTAFSLRNYSGNKHTKKCSCSSAIMPASPIRQNCTYSNGKKTALASFPRSGNTVLRVLIEMLTNIQTSSLYCDPSFTSFFKGECGARNCTTVVQKTHYPNFGGINELAFHEKLSPRYLWYDKIIWIVRNPFDAFYSYKQYIQSAHNHTHHTPLSIGSITLHNISNISRKFANHFYYWLNATATVPSLVIRFEDLIFSNDDFKQRFLYELLEFLVPEIINDISSLTLSELVCCAIESVILRPGDIGTSLPYVKMPKPPLHSIKYFSPEAIEFMLKALHGPICLLGYASTIEESLNNTRHIDCSDFNKN